MALRFDESGVGIRIIGRGGYHGKIDTGGRWPGRLKTASSCCTFSPEEVVEIGKKCVEVRRQVQSIRSLRKALCE